MGPAELGAIIGGFLIGILLPVLILIICSFIPAVQRSPGIVYAVCILIAIAVPFLGASINGNYLDASISGCLAGAFIWWGYTRAAKKARSLGLSSDSGRSQ
jgi:hypothetical protein